MSKCWAWWICEEWYESLFTVACLLLCAVYHCNRYDKIGCIDPFHALGTAREHIDRITKGLGEHVHIETLVVHLLEKLTPCWMLWYILCHKLIEVTYKHYFWVLSNLPFLVLLRLQTLHFLVLWGFLIFLLF